MAPVSVIIPAYNAAATIAETLKSLSLQDYPGPIEVIVVDDGSTDRTPDVVRRFPSVRYVRQDNAGPASARNHGARKASGTFLCFTDSDCVPHPDWISMLIKGFGARATGVVAGSYGIANPHQPLAAGIHAEIVFRHRHLLPDFPRFFGSYNFCIRKEFFERIGGFSESYRQASGEDNDLSYRVQESGHRIFFARGALVDHYHTMRVGKYLREQFRHGFWRATMYARHPNMASGDDYTFWKDIVEVPWSALCLVSGICAGLGVTHAAIVFLCTTVSFVFFEIAFALHMMRRHGSGVLFGFVMFLRAFARAAGLAKGIYHSLFRRR
jgi:glycosyltransferase involved in cell wall biosynthesis